MNEVLLLSNDNSLKRIFQTELKLYDITLQVESLINDGMNALMSGRYKSVVINYPLLTECCPKKLIQHIKSTHPCLPVYFLMDQIRHHDIIALVKQGAENIFVQPFNISQLCKDLHAAISRFPPSSHTRPFSPLSNDKAFILPREGYMHAQSKAARAMYKQIDKVADTNFTVIIYGETGTGKESVARRLSAGRYKDRPFVAVDCGCLNKELASSELFGHKKGSFTSALTDKVGAFEKAHQGTLFLDEIGNLDYNVQIQLLRAIEEKKIRKVGCHEEKNVDVRIIVASNEKLLLAVKEGRFREDLYYRLNEFEINIPPLRKRRDDILPFIQYFIGEANKELHKKVLGVEEGLLTKLLAYNWPGNIRELKNIIRRGCLMADEYIDITCMTQEFLALLELNVPSSDTHQAKQDDPIKTKVAQLEYEQIMHVLAEENYNKTSTAIRLNINRKTLYNKLRNYEQLCKTQSHIA